MSRKEVYLGHLFLILIGDINNEIINSIIKSFANNTRATKLIMPPDDVRKLQNDLQIIYEWTINNNMELNDVKFELLRYGLNNDIKSHTNYTTPTGKTITTKDSVKDLGVYMSNDCLFKQSTN